jgi:hypothetical protein
MRKIYVCFLLIGLLFAVGCSQNSNDKNEIEGVILSIEDQMALLSITNDPNDLCNSDQLEIFVGITGHEQLVVGEKVVVTINGWDKDNPMPVLELVISKQDGMLVEVVQD